MLRPRKVTEMPDPLTIKPAERSAKISEPVPLQSIVIDCEMVTAPKLNVGSRQATIPPAAVTETAAEIVLHGVSRLHRLDVLPSLPALETHVEALTDAAAGVAEKTDAENAIAATDQSTGFSMPIPSIW